MFGVPKRHALNSNSGKRNKLLEAAEFILRPQDNASLLETDRQTPSRSQKFFFHLPIFRNLSNVCGKVLVCNLHCANATYSAGDGAAHPCVSEFRCLCLWAKCRFRSEQCIQTLVIPAQETLPALAERCKLNCVHSAATGTVRYHGNLLIKGFHNYRNMEQVNCADVHSTLSLFACRQGT
jgi:hypothetical protein